MTPAKARKITKAVALSYIEAMAGCNGDIRKVARKAGLKVAELRAGIASHPLARQAWLEETDKAEFQEWAAKRCTAAGRVWDPLSPLAESAATLLARARRAERGLRKAELLGKTQRGGARRNPLSVEATECRRELRLVLAQLGLATDATPAKKDPSEGEMDALLHRDGRRKMRVL